MIDNSAYPAPRGAQESSDGAGSPPSGSSDDPGNISTLPQEQTAVQPEEPLPSQAQPQPAYEPPSSYVEGTDPELEQQYQNQAQAPLSPEYSQEAYQRPQPEEVVLEWQAPSRPFKKRNRQYYTTIAVIVFLICMILFFAGQFLPIAVVIAVAFLAYVLSAVPPETILNRVTTYGIRTDDALYYWEELGRFWFTTRYNQRLVHIETSRFPNQITLVLNEQDEAELADVLGVVLLNEQPALTSFDKAAQWMQEKIPLDTEA